MFTDLGVVIFASHELRKTVVSGCYQIDLPLEIPLCWFRKASYDRLDPTFPHKSEPHVFNIHSALFDYDVSFVWPDVSV